jgi:phosphoenolpyruvate-protein phosphotransferase (PTS system enzyme I)
MEIKRGTAVSPGVAIGPALVLDTEWYRIPQRFVPLSEREAEVTRLRKALDESAREARQSQDAVSARLGPQYGAIFGAHAVMLADPTLAREVEALIRDQHFSAEYAVSRVMRRHAKALENIGGLMAERVGDVFDLEKRILGQLLGQRREQMRRLSEPVIVLAHDLTPSEAASLDPKHVHGFATEAGGRASHTAIVAGVLEIPAVVGVGKFITDVSGGDLVIVDGHRGLLILNPDEETLERYERARKSFRRHETDLLGLRELPAVTRDGVRIRLHGNIEFPQECAACLDRGAEGVGLYRTEFLYLNKEADPTEAEHLDAYLQVLRALGPGRPLVIRTLDLGADKFLPPSESGAHEKNPFLGLRSVRLCLRNLALFKTQMRAILRASAFGDVRIMFPMISTLLELRQCKMILAEVKEDLEDEGIAFNARLPAGTMIEVPSAAILADQLAREVDFFSIGTNDLVQYTLAADRNNETVAALYNPGDPAVLRLLDNVVKAAQKAGIEVNVCGEMSGEPVYTLLLLGLGLRSLSVAPHNLPEVKKVVRSVTTDEAVAVAQEALRLDTARDVNNYLREQTRRILPEVVS